MRDLLALFSGIAVIGVVWGALVLLKRLTRRRARPGTRPVREIEAEYGRDYLAPGRKGEPFFSPGGLALIGSIIASTIMAYLLSPYIHAIADWLAPVTRSPR